MQQKLLRKAGSLGILIAVAGLMLGGCVDEPNPNVPEHIKSEVRYVHAIPDVPAIDLYIDSEKVAASLGYKAATAYLVVNSGDRVITVKPAGSNDTVISQRMNVRSLYKITTIFHGMHATKTAAVLSTQERPVNANETAGLVDSGAVKLVNVNERGVTVTLADSNVSGPALIPDVNFGSLSSYSKIKSGAHDFFVVTSGIEVVSFKQDVATAQRWTYLLVGESNMPEVVRIQDDP